MISNSKINEIYNLVKNGALGGKLLGAGGGFLLMYMNKEKENSFSKNIKN